MKVRLISVASYSVDRCRGVLSSSNASPWVSFKRPNHWCQRPWTMLPTMSPYLSHQSLHALSSQLANLSYRHSRCQYPPTARHLLVRAVALDWCPGAHCLAAHPPDSGTRIADLSSHCSVTNFNQKSLFFT